MARPRSPRKKEDLPKGSPESLMSMLKAGTQFALMVLGIVGLAVKIFSDEGWLVQLARKVTQIESFGSLVIIPLVIGALFVLRILFERTFGKSSAAVLGTLAMNVMMLVGFYFLVRLLTEGTF